MPRVRAIVAERHESSARDRPRLIEARLRAEVDGADRSLAAPIRAAQRDRIPYIAVLGDREVGEGTVALRLRDGARQPDLPVEEVLRLVSKVDALRSVALFPGGSLHQSLVRQPGPRSKRNLPKPRP